MYGLWRGVEAGSIKASGWHRNRPMAPSIQGGTWSAGTSNTRSGQKQRRRRLSSKGIEVKITVVVGWEQEGCLGGGGCKGGG